MRNTFFSVVALLFSITSQTACAQQSTDSQNTATNIVKLGQLPAEVKESSGLALAGQPGVFYTQGDAGTEPVLFKFSTEGKLLNKILLPIPNKDWESLAHDYSGNVYICDCGNNSNNRRDLAIYRVNPEAPDQVTEIKFSYPDQRKFPPRKKQRNFDSEASFWHNGNLFLFSRDRGQGQTSKVYRVPAQAGNHQAKLVASLPISGEVTGASISKSGKRMVLLTKQNIFVFDAENLDGLLKASPKQYSNGGVGQTEGVDFLDENNLLISTEEGELFTMPL